MPISIIILDHNHHTCYIRIPQSQLISFLNLKVTTCQNSRFIKQFTYTKITYTINDNYQTQLVTNMPISIIILGHNHHTCYIRIPQSQPISFLNLKVTTCNHKFLLNSHTQRKTSFPYLTKRLNWPKQLNRLKEHQNTFNST